MIGSAGSRVLNDLDPGVRRFMDGINSAYASHLDFLSLPFPDRRALAEKIRAPWRAAGPEMVETREMTTGDVRVRLHRPTAQPDLPVLMYVHGGGWTLFSIDTHDRVMREYAARAGVVVIGIDYSLSPEAKFPIALDEVVAAIAWLREHAEELGINADRIALGGDSAGANLAVAACLVLREQRKQMPDVLLLNYGAFAPEPFESFGRFDGPSYFLQVEEMNAFWSNYVNDPSDFDNPLVVPLSADVTGLPPTFLAIAELDILAGCNHAFAKKLANAGVKVEMRSYRGATHSFLEAVSISEIAQQAFEDAATFLSERLHEPKYRPGHWPEQANTLA